MRDFATLAIRAVVSARDYRTRGQGFDSGYLQKVCISLRRSISMFFAVSSSFAKLEIVRKFNKARKFCVDKLFDFFRKTNIFRSLCLLSFVENIRIFMVFSLGIKHCSFRPTRRHRILKVLVKAC